MAKQTYTNTWSPEAKTFDPAAPKEGLNPEYKPPALPSATKAADKFAGIKTVSKERGIAEFGKLGVNKPTPPPETKFSPYEALQGQKPGDEPVSPYVKEPILPIQPPTDEKPAEAPAASDLQQGFDQFEQEHDQLFELAEELKDQKHESYD